MSYNTAAHTLVGAAANGCDSIVTLNLASGKYLIEVKKGSNQPVIL